MLWVLGGAEVKPNSGFVDGLSILGFVELIWGESTELDASSGLES